MTQNQTKGLIFPIILTAGSSTLTEGLDLIKASLKIILSWPLTTRNFNGEFGSRLYEAIEEQNDMVLSTLIRRFIIDSISNWEKRIELVSIKAISPSSERVEINLTYRVKELNIQDSLFYVYYIN